MTSPEYVPTPRTVAARRFGSRSTRQPIYEVDPLTCPRCGGEMRVIALIQEPAVIDKILRHLREKGRDARAGPWATGPPGGRGGSREGVTAEAA